MSEGTDLQLAELATEINAEHQKVKTAFASGFEHALHAGKLLTEAKKKLPHGDWLPWLERHCNVSKRTAQAYMRLAREVPKLDDENAQRVAHLSFREAVHQISTSTSGLSEIRDDIFEEAVAAAETEETFRPIRTEAKRIEMARMVGDSLDHAKTSIPDGPLFNERAVEIWTKRDTHRWCVAVFPNDAGMKLRESVAALGKDEAAEEAIASLLAEAEELEERAAQLRAQASDEREISIEIQAEILRDTCGTAYHFAETHDFTVTDSEFEAELDALETSADVAAALFAEFKSETPRVEFTKTGYWGDMSLSKYSANGMGWTGADWTGIGSADNFWRGRPIPAAEETS